MDWGPRITYLASTAFKERVVPFGIKDADRQKHVCVIGKVGSGRASLMARMALQDVERGLGTIIIDASGNLAPVVMERLSADELTRLVHIDAADAEYPFSWNSANEFRAAPRGAALFPDALASLYGVARSPFTDFLASWVLADESRTILSPHMVLIDEKERDVAFLPESDDAKEFARLREAHAEDLKVFIENGRFLFKDTMVRNMVGQVEHKVSFEALSRGAIIIFDLSRIRIFPTRVAPLVRLATYALRAWTDENQTAALYLHDCLRYLTESDAEGLLTDQRFALTLSDTLYREADLPLREKALARCGSVIAFTPHQSDVSLVQKIYYPYVSPEELQGLEAGEACVLLTIDATRAKPFFANALVLPERKSVSLQDILVESRKKYTTPRTQVDEQFKKQTDAEKKKNQPPFNDAFKNIFAKRDPTKALAMTGDKKPDAEKPKEEPPAEPPQTPPPSAPPPAATPPPATPPPTTPPPPPTVPDAPASSQREVPENELRELMFVLPIPL
jgi:hypothetical protein